MSFGVWPEYMVLPEGDDFHFGEWETPCGTRGCAWGWLCTAFDEDDSIFSPSMVSPGSPAGQFARALAKGLDFDMEYYDELLRNPDLGVKYALSEAFECCELPEDEVAERWRRAARRKGYVVDAGMFE